MNKEVLTFVGSLALFGALVAMGGADGSSGDGRRRTRTQEQPVLVAAKPAPGRFIPDAQETWSAEGRNVFIAPSDLKEPPPLELAWPPLRRAALPAPPLPFPAAAASTKALRRPYDVTAAAPTNGGGSGGGEAAAASGSGGETTTPAEPAATSDKPPGTDLSPGARFEKERKRLEAERAEQRRRAGLDSITIAGNDVRYGEFAGSLDRDLSRYEVKRRFDLLRREGGITESERTDRLKKMTLVFYEIAKTGKKGRRQTHTADTVTEIKFADTPVNRYQERRLEAAPADLDAQLELIASLMPEREWKLASDDLQTLRARGRTSPKLYELLADALHEQFAYEAALEALREGVAKHPEAVGLYARLGRTLNVMGLRSEAIEAFRKALEKNPSDHVANAGLGEALLRDGKPGPALAALREAVNATNVDPMSVESARIWLARAALASGDVRNAEAAVGLVLQRFKAGEDLSAAPPARRALHRRATAVASVVALLQGQAAEARRFAEEGVRAHPEDGVLRFALGMVALHENRLDEARRLLEEAPSFDPLLTARCKAALAFVHELSGRDGDAATTAEQAALVADPSDAALRAPFGRALLNAGDAARAREQLLVALEAQPSDADVLVALGDAAYRDGALQEAIRYYDRAATLEPDFPDLTARRITTHVRRKRLKEAEELVNAASAIRLKEPPMQAAAAYFHYVRGNHDEAGVILQKMLDPSVTLPDAIRAYARQAAYAIGDHRNKQVWTDQFNRTDPRIGREWKVEKGAGVNVTLVDQAVLFDGAQSGVSDRPTYLHQERPGDKLHAFSIDLNLEAPLDGVFAGAGLMARSKTAPKEKWPGYQDRADGWAPQAGLQVAIDPAGKLVWRKLEQTKMSDWQEVPGAPEGARSLTLEFRQSNPAEGKWDVLVNREALLKDVEISDLKRWSRTLELQAFCYGRLGAKVRFTVDNATIVTLKEKR